MSIQIIIIIITVIACVDNHFRCFCSLFTHVATKSLENFIAYEITCSVSRYIGLDLLARTSRGGTLAALVSCCVHLIINAPHTCFRNWQ